MIAPIFQDPSFNQEWMARNKRLRDAVYQGAASVGSPAHGAVSSTTQVQQTGQVEAPSTQSETPNAVATASEGSQSRSSTEKPESTKESEKESRKEPEKDTERVELTPDEKRRVSQLQTIDRNIRAHEQAHLSAAQGIAISAANYSYQVGPDDKRYAVAGEVTIDTSKENEPEKTINKGYRIIHTALAPADPSPQDRSVAAGAEQMILEAQAELMRESYAVNRQSDAGQRSGEIIDQQA